MVVRGQIEVIAGPMYAGKTSKLLQKILWLQHQEKNMLVLKPAIDNRYSEDTITTHNQLSFPCYSMSNWDDVVENYVFEQYDTVCLDEVQFMDTENTMFNVEHCLRKGINVFAAGLDQDSRGVPFETTARLLGLADKVTKIRAYCNECGKPATKTQRLVDAGDRVAVGSTGMYVPRCTEHWIPK